MEIEAGARGRPYCAGHCRWIELDRYPTLSRRVGQLSGVGILELLHGRGGLDRSDRELSIQACPGREESDGSLNRQYFEVNLAFYASIVLVLWYYWNFFGSLFPETESAAVGLIHLEMWTLVDPLFVLVSGVTGFRLWRMAAMR